MVLSSILVKSMEAKISIRKQKLTLRNQLTKEDQENKSNQIMNRTLALSAIVKAECILCYAGYQSEVSTSELIAVFLQQGKKVYLPRVNDMDMDFYRIQSLSDLATGYKGIPEPKEDCNEVFSQTTWESYKESAVILMPGAAFSKKGARIGYGKGFYDRYLSRFPIHHRIALSYELQMTETIPSDEFDIPVTMIVTEEKQYTII